MGVFGKIGDGFKAVGNGISSAASWTGDKVNTFMENPVGNTWVGVRETAKFGHYVVLKPLTDIPGNIKEQGVLGALSQAGQDYGRRGALIAQGGTHAVTSTVGMVGDLGRWSVRHTWNGATGLMGMEDRHWDKPDRSISQAWSEAWTFLDPPADGTHEKVLQYGSQATVEVAAFVAVSVVTAGTAGAAMGAARGGGAMARASSYGSKTGRFMNPIQSTTAIVLSTGAVGINTTLKMEGAQRDHQEQVDITTSILSQTLYGTSSESLETEEVLNITPEFKDSASPTHDEQVVPQFNGDALSELLYGGEGSKLDSKHSSGFNGHAGQTNFEPQIQPQGPEINKNTDELVIIPK